MQSESQSNQILYGPVLDTQNPFKIRGRLKMDGLDLTLQPTVSHWIRIFRMGGGGEWALPLRCFFPSMASRFSWHSRQRNGPSQGRNLPLPDLEVSEWTETPSVGFSSVWHMAHMNSLNMFLIGYSVCNLCFFQIEQTKVSISKCYKTNKVIQFLNYNVNFFKKNS